MKKDFFFLQKNYKKHTSDGVDEDMTVLTKKLCALLIAEQMCFLDTTTKTTRCQSTELTVKQIIINISHIHRSN